MCGQFRRQAGAQTQESAGLMATEAELLGQLAVDRLDALMGTVEPPRHGLRHAATLIAARHGQQGALARCALLVGQRGTAVTLVPDNREISLLAQQFGAHRHIAHAGQGESEIAAHLAEGDQQVQLVAEGGLLLGRHRADYCDRRPAGSGARHGGHMMGPGDRHRQTVDGALAIRRHIEHGESQQADYVNRVPQVAPGPVEAAALGGNREALLLCPPAVEQRRLPRPAAALADRRHHDQVAIAATRHQPAARLIGRRQSPVSVVDHHIRPQTAVVERHDHRQALPLSHRPSRSKTTNSRQKGTLSNQITSIRPTNGKG